jgi:hypothetical protein
MSHWYPVKNIKILKIVSVLDRYRLFSCHSSLNKNVTSIYIALILGIISHLERTSKCIRGCIQVICECCAILYKGLEHPKILVPMRVLEPIPCGDQGLTLLAKNLEQCM